VYQRYFDGTLGPRLEPVTVKFDKLEQELERFLLARGINRDTMFAALPA
jgi:hypothetical protein